MLQNAYFRNVNKTVIRICLLRDGENHFQRPRCVNMGYDADSSAAIVGGLAGLYYGYDSIPAEWFDALVNKELIEDRIKGLEEYGNGL